MQFALINVIVPSSLLMEIDVIRAEMFTDRIKIKVKQCLGVAPCHRLLTVNNITCSSQPKLETSALPRRKVDLLLGY